MFTLKKEVKDVLKIFSTLAYNMINDNIPVITIIAENNELVLFQERPECTLYYKTGIDSNDSFMVYWNVKDFCSLIEKLNCDVMMDFKGIHTQTGKYTFNSVKVNKSEEATRETLRIILLNPEKQIYFKNFKKPHLVKGFVGKKEDDNGMDYTSVFFSKDKVLANNDGALMYRENAVEDEYINDFSNIDEDLLLKDIILKAIPEDNQYNISLYGNDLFWSLDNVDTGVKIFINFKYNQKVPDMDSPEFKKVYDHESHILFDYNIFKSKLDMVMITAYNNPNNRLYLVFKENKMFIENRDNSETSDFIDCKYPESFEGRYIIINGKTLQQVSGLMNGMTKAYIDLDKPIVRFANAQGEDKRLILYARLNELERRN